MSQTSRELVRRCLKFETPERVPRQLWALPWVDERYPKEMKEIRARFPADITGPGVDVYRPSPRLKGNPCDEGVYIDEWGCVFTNIQRGVVGEWTHRPDGASQWTSYLQLSTLRYPGQNLRDANRHVLGTSYATALRGGWVVFGGLYAGTENERAANVPHLGHRLAGLRVGLQKSINADVDLFANAGYETRHHGGADPYFLVNRRDRQTNLNLGLTWVPVVNWRVTPQLSLLRTNSNIAISDFSKRVLSVTVRKDF